jgi:hypothetical protein
VALLTREQTIHRGLAPIGKMEAVPALTTKQRAEFTHSKASRAITTAPAAVRQNRLNRVRLGNETFENATR